jgi:hypothetical protein
MPFGFLPESRSASPEYAYSGSLLGALSKLPLVVRSPLPLHGVHVTRVTGSSIELVDFRISMYRDEHSSGVPLTGLRLRSRLFQW